MSKNITVLLPGSCNASCEFCFWNRDFRKIKIDHFIFIKKVFNLLKKLPPEYDSLSISGGEPTLSPVFKKFLIHLIKFRNTNNNIKKVVLNTNGTNIKQHIDLIGCIVDHVNISRHELNFDNNVKIFKTDKIPSDKKLIKIIKKLHFVDIDVTMNCVISDHTTYSFCESFIQYTKKIKADAIYFRKQAGNLDPTPTELLFNDRYENYVSECPVCRTSTSYIDGINVSWKCSITEPSIILDETIYELIIHADGEIYSDWNMKRPVSLIQRQKKKLNVDNHDYYNCRNPSRC